ncbi:hypothetical protein ATE68_04040 [Sphingopyxis sp. H038]|nr:MULTISPECIES: hypothetical protein [unclassified Sphingopyxis]KTE29051.1 hypothetical protein ATE75_09630 [Sphingopyxis sp. H080]KTE44717.1 hypothetical protein ATE77_08880 [Sphingopyxis sp. H005]KTE47694.1 hypothetical protein ATE73_07110 [Sphingopyxis sp. H077]KTE68959.1 hypothetical protein ATE74_09370 [Sphingopyxis sp. H085]KTE03067.1 hypothetical protein ATE78_07115 [Sphingopyxis sp. H012]
MSLLALGCAAASAVPAQAPSLAMLDRLEKGSWQLRERGKDDVLQTICVGDARRMIQIQHPRSTCSRYVIEDTPNSVTVHYTCPGAGHGRTSIRSETNRLVQIDTQGIAEGRPFSQAIEARRAGGC